MRPVILSLVLLAASFSAGCGQFGDEDGDGWTVAQGDCNDGDAEVSPDADEICDDDIDNDCDGNVARNLVGYYDRDGDWYGELDVFAEFCTNANVLGHGYAATPGDCEPNDATIYPGAEEICDDGVDNDCDDDVDEEDCI